MSSTHDLTFSAYEVVKAYVDATRGEPEQEWAALGVLAAHAPDLAPRPLRRTTSGEGRPVVVMSRLPGRPVLDVGWSPAVVRAAARAWWRLWSIPVAETGLGARRLGPSEFPTSVREWSAADAGDLGQCRDPELVHAALAAAREWLGAPDLPDDAVDPVLGLGDGNAANLLWDGRVCRLVDFEDAGVSDVAFEMADTTEHVSVRLHGSVDPTDLVAEVGLSEDQHERWSAYRPLFAAFWLVMLLPARPGFRRNPPGSTEDQARHLLALLGSATTGAS